MKQIKIQVLQIKSLVSSPAINHHIIPSSICTQLSTVPFLGMSGHRSPDFHEPVFSNSTQETLFFPSSTAPEMSKSVTPSFVGLFFPSPSFLPSFFLFLSLFSSLLLSLSLSFSLSFSSTLNHSWTSQHKPCSSLIFHPHILVTTDGPFLCSSVSIYNVTKEIKSIPGLLSSPHKPSLI